MIFGIVGQGRRVEFRQSLGHTKFMGQVRAGFGDSTIFDGATAEKMPANRLYFHREFNNVWPGRWASGVEVISRGTAWSGGSSNGFRIALASVVAGNADLVPNARLGAAGENTSATGGNVAKLILFPANIWVPYGDFLIVCQFDGFNAGNSQTIFTPHFGIYSSAISGNFYSKKASESGADYSYASGIPAAFSQVVGNYVNCSGGAPADMFMVMKWVDQ